MTTTSSSPEFNTSTLLSPSSTNTSSSIPHTSSTWSSDSTQQFCYQCASEFTPFNRRHHCRLCGKIFCHSCSSQKSLIPPSSIVLLSNHRRNSSHTFQPDRDPDRILTYSSPEDDDIPLYGKGLEERYKLAREPLRVCDLCHEKLRPLQNELRASNSNAVRYNAIDPTDFKRLLNSPLAFTLGHEIRKAAYTLNNLLPLPKRVGLLTDPHTRYTHTHRNACTSLKQNCSTVSPSLSNLDGVRIPARLLLHAKGIAVLTVFKGGFALGVEFGTGLVVAKLPDGRNWSAPSAIGTAGMSWGALIGAQVSDHVFLLMTESAVEMMMSDEGSLQLGADVAVSVGPLGRSVEADLAASSNGFAPIYTYSLSKGLYAGASLDGKIIVTRHAVNEKFYGQKVAPKELLSGDVPIPPAAQPLYDALKRCQVYVTSSGTNVVRGRRNLEYDWGSVSDNVLGEDPVVNGEGNSYDEDEDVSEMSWS